MKLANLRVSRVGCSHRTNARSACAHKTHPGLHSSTGRRAALPSEHDSTISSLGVHSLQVESRLSFLARDVRRRPQCIDAAHWAP